MGSLQRIFRIISLIVLVSGAGNLTAQVIQRATLTGQITNATDGKPLPFSSVYLNGTTRGTTADENGQFSLADVPFGANELVVSYTGFSAVKQAIRVTEAKPRPMAVALFPMANQLTDVVVTAKKDKTWLRQVEQFKTDMIGTTSFAKQCILTNPEALEFEESGETLFASARQPLVIENMALGYRLTYTLLSFRSYNRTGRIVFSGTNLFKELTPESPKQAKQWQRNRAIAYQGSLRHLLASLAAGTFEKEGFLIYQTDPVFPLVSNPPPLFSAELGRHLKNTNVMNLVTTGTLPHERWLVSSSPLEIFYPRITIRDSPYRDVQYAFSQLALPQQSLGFTVTGQITAPRGFEAIGYLSNDRLATALPDDWQHDASVAQPATRSDSTRTQPTRTPAPDATLDTLVNRWKRQPNLLASGILVQIDKPLYLTGDRLWLSGYVVDMRTHRIDTANVGPALNVELWSSANTLVQHQWLAVEAGRATGTFRLDDTLATGTYWLRAYTETDRVDAHVAFERPFLVVNPKTPFNPPPTTVGQPDEDIKKPNLGGIEYVQEAPGAPYRTSVALDSTQLTLTLEAPTRSRFPTAYVLMDARGKLLQSTRIQVSGKLVSTKWSILTWPSGTAQLSLIDSTGRLWAKRLVRVPERASRIVADLDKRNATEADPLTITLHDEAGRPVWGQVSVAVTDASQVPPDSLVPDFAARLMNEESRTAPVATPGITLQGHVSTSEKQPVNVSIIATDQQGVVMRATQTDASGNFQIDGLSLADTAQIIVQVTNRRGKPVDAKVGLESPSAAFGLVSQWSPAPQLFGQWKSLIELAKQRQAANPAQYRQENARQLREVVVRAARSVDERPADIQQRSLHNQVDQTILMDDKSASFDNLYSLIRAKVPGVLVQQVLESGQVRYSVKFTSGGTVATLAGVAPVVARGSAPAPPSASPAVTMQNPLFLMDGMPINDTDGMQLLMYSASNIERVEVLKTASISAIYGMQAGHGVIAFYTKVPRNTSGSKGVSRLTLLGYPTVQPFPGEKNTAANSMPADVLAWAPLARTNKLGQISVPLRIPKSVHQVRVTIQGIAATGQAISSVQILTVD